MPQAKASARMNEIEWAARGSGERGVCKKNESRAAGGAVQALL